MISDGRTVCVVSASTTFTSRSTRLNVGTTTLSDGGFELMGWMDRRLEVSSR